MSQVYSTEPQTTGRVILNTTHGPIDIQLWCKECPTTTRTFLQLCLDGYYNGMIFHRIINNFLIQTGEIRKNDIGNIIQSSSPLINEEDYQRYMTQYAFGKEGREKKDETIPGSDEFMTRKRLELSSRIRFNHRGQIAMAIPLDEEDVEEGKESSSLARQFFITMDEAQFLHSKYVIFGTVSGDTIFNAMRIGRTETIDEESGQLVDLDNAPMIKDVRIENHLFDDLVMTNEDNVPWKLILKDSDGQEGISDLKKRRKKRKGKKDLNVLSFGNEMEDGEDDEVGGMVSTYDVLKTKKANKIESNDEKNKIHVDNKKINDYNDDEKKNQMDKESTTKTNFEGREIQHNIEVSSKMRQKVVEKTSSATMSYKSETDFKSKDVDTPKMSAVEARRMKYLKANKANNKSHKELKLRDDSTMLKLSAFKSKMFEVKGTKLTKNDDINIERSQGVKIIENVQSKPEELPSAQVYSGQILEDNESYENDSSWMKKRFKCKRHIDHDSKESAMGGDGRNMEDYEVIDDKAKHNSERSSSHHHKRHKHR